MTERRLRLHVLPYLGRHELAALKPSHIRGLDRKMQDDGLSETYRAVAFGNVSAILNAAVDDERIAKNPCQARTVRPPRIGESKVVPWTRDQLMAVRAAFEPRLVMAVDFGAGCGLRQGEILGLAVEDVDEDRGVVHVVRQLKIVGNRLVFARPKGRKTRDVPLSSWLVTRLAAHTKDFAPVAVTLPWEIPSGEPVTANLLHTGKTGVALARNYFNDTFWWPAVEAAGLPKDRTNGMHALRHLYASAVLDGGESIKALAAYLGHADPGFTLRTYTHLMPTSETRTWRAVDRLFTGE